MVDPMSRATSISDAARDAFYVAAVAGLRALDAREPTPRRFGPDADIRWSSFAGSLTDADRLDLLLRDATNWGAAFSPSEAFGLFGLAPDEPFGPDWRPLLPSAARRLFASAPADSPRDYAALLGLDPKPFTLPPLVASTRVAVAGPSALVALADAFQNNPDLRWSSQVLAVASTPSHRQLAALLALATHAPSRTPLVHPGPDPTSTLRSAGFAQVDHALASNDAEPDCAAFIRSLS